MKNHIRYEAARLKKRLAASPLAAFADQLLTLHMQGWKRVLAHGDFPRWQAGFDALPAVSPSEISLNSPTVKIGAPADTDMPTQCIGTALKQMHPWRKGPFDFFGTHVDTEWRSDWKWNRLNDVIAPLTGRTVLDIGCGSGYHCWRMRGAGASFVLGIDPTPLFSMQFAAAKHYQPEAPVFMLPVGIESMPANMACFDTVFSMGILYHRKSPIDHLLELKDLLNDGGELILETLVIEGDENACLVPAGRYAKMRNVWFIPSVPMLERWLARAGFRNIQCIDVSMTTAEEQRSTEWMQFESLADFLDPANPGRTIEGCPAPRRAIWTAETG
ncbi:MAG: tRNA 5-methoxyuridine(34)/uridine 5-oxyacetic acid(34) synthase CmoB [Mariprofundaceae bacterium]|nr:tRNA 5-methoxyuridine(34)/uridine 5-oxyacetic acid(34) synthase CmoB [Mariprofundaceae bacterium]